MPVSPPVSRRAISSGDAVWREERAVLTDELAKLDWYRTLANAPVTIGAASWALANGGRCGGGPNMMVVCQVRQWDFGGGTTYGSTFSSDTDMEKAIGDDDLMKHETAHSRQWAAQGPVPMIAGYGLSAGYSKPCHRRHCLCEPLRMGRRNVERRLQCLLQLDTA